MFLPTNDIGLSYPPFLFFFSVLYFYFFTILPFLLTAFYSKLSTIDLIKHCCQESKDWEQVWQEFESRFGKLISIYVIKEYRRYSKYTNSQQLNETVRDLRQDVYIKLLNNQGKALRTFRGSSDKSFFAYLYTISRNVVINHLKKNEQGKLFISGADFKTGIENNEIELLSFETTESVELACLQVSLLQVLEKHYKSRNYARDILIFELFYFQGLSATDIQRIYNVDLSVSGIETVANRVKQSLHKKLL